MNKHLLKPSLALKSKFPHEPTGDQLKLFLMMDDFILNNDQERKALMIKGYAGTGKTSVVSSLVKVLKYYDYKSLLLAPTGRASKVMAQYAERKAFTIHKIIYKLKSERGSDKLVFSKNKNYYKKTIFIVDEVSMLSDRSEFGSASLLDDLISYVFENKSNRLILIGDNAQLPPVGQEDSPALQIDRLLADYKLDIQEVEFTQVMRQQEGSGILFNATNIREQIRHKTTAIRFKTRGFSDIFKMTAEKMEDGLRYAYDKFGIENTIIICRSNREAVQYNEYIRRSIMFYENEIEAGDYLMVVRNNYTVLEDDSPAGFIANGDFVEVMKIKNFEDMHGFRFATLELRLIDYPQQLPFEAKVVLDTLHANTTAMTTEENKKLYDSVRLDYEDIVSRKDRNKAIKSDEYLSALQVKFAYALTCHKSQGGQWESVFVSQGYLKDDMLNHEYLRWLYTALTRATNELYLMNFDKRFF